MKALLSAPSFPFRRALLLAAGASLLAAWMHPAPPRRNSQFSILNSQLSTKTDSSRLYTPDDLEATVWAESPMLYNPTNMDVDARGRIWVTEAVDYRDFNNKPDQHLHRTNGERVVILQDTDGDGKADKSTVFVEDKDLVSPLGIAVIGNRVIVSAAPNLVVYTDENGDDKPDKKEILLTGFGGLDHDHSLHSVTAGPDGRWYFNTGNAGPHHVVDKSGWHLRSGSIYTGGTPYNTKNEGNQRSDDGRVWVGGLALRINPDGTGLKVLGHNFRNNYETAVDSYGNLWQNDNDDQVIACRTSFLPEGGNAGYFSTYGTRYWQADRRPGQEIFTAHWHQEDPGVMPVPENTGAGSPTGITRYEGDALGPKYRGVLLSAEAGRNVIYGYWPQKQGAGFALKRHNLITTLPQDNVNYQWYETGEDTRKWFRPSDVTAGTDGALYIADWYDPIVGGHAMHDKVGYGRIYRITPKGRKITAPKIDLTTTDGQIQALKNPAINVRNAGFVALRAQGEKAVPAVRALLADENPFVRARATFLLAQLGEAGKKEAESQLKSADPDARLVAFRALKALNPQSAIANPQLAADPDPALRREVAISLRDVPLSACRTTVEELVKRFDGRDGWMRVALGLALDGAKGEQFYPDLKKLFNATDPVTWPEPVAALAFETHPKAAVNDLTLRAGSAKVSEAGRRQALTALAFIRDKTATQAMLSLTKSSLKDVRETAGYWLTFRRTNDWADLLDWKDAAAQASPQMQRMMKLQVDVGSELPMPQRVKAAEEMARDAAGGKMLLALAAENRLPNEVKTAVAKVIYNNPDLQVRSLAADYFPREGKDWKGKLYSVDYIAKLQPDARHGQQVFATFCTTCHKHGQTGAEIGPDLTEIHKKFDQKSLLDALINPSAALVFGYEPWLVTTKKGETVYGFLVSDGATLVLKDAGGQQHAFRKDQIKSRKQLTTSLMPEPSALGLNDQDLADLTGYLLSFKN
jgi:putative membrane-bound dehydrogenase-like protein